MNRERIEAKMTDREALAAALKVYQNLPLTPEFATITKAAYKYLAQLPEKCGTCAGHGHYWQPSGDTTCEPCRGTGKVYPAELVERLKQGTTFPAAMVVMFLDALNGETE